MAQTHYMTKKGKDKLATIARNKYKKMREQESQMQHHADTTGDQWHDNPVLHELTRQTDISAGQVAEATRVLSNAYILEYPEKVETAGYGTRVRITVEGRPDAYDIVGYGDEDPDEDRIRYDSPIAQSIKGLKPGDKTEAEIPLGSGKKKTIEVIAVEPLDLSEY